MTADLGHKKKPFSLKLLDISTSALESGLDAEGVLGVHRTPKMNFGHPQGVQVSQDVDMGVHIESCYFLCVMYSNGSVYFFGLLLTFI